MSCVMSKKPKRKSESEETHPFEKKASAKKQKSKLQKIHEEGKIRAKIVARMASVMRGHITLKEPEKIRFFCFRLYDLRGCSAHEIILSGIVGRASVLWIYR
jgi:hypothetical protein